MAQNHPDPANGYDLGPIECEICKKNLLTEDDACGNYVYVQKHDSELYVGIHAVCKEHDDRLQAAYKEQGCDAMRWNDIDDLKNPKLWIIRLMEFFNEVQQYHDMSPEAFESMKQIFLKTYPYVCRQLTEDEKRRYNDLCQFGLL